MESVWKQLALCESKLEAIEKRCAKSDDKMVKVGQEIHEVRENVNSIGESQISLVNNVKNLESKVVSEVSQLDQRLPSFSNRNE
jgi:predicted  nucleic acid-binding Zn-ribbon protein